MKFVLLARSACSAVSEILDDWREWLIEPSFRRFVRGPAHEAEATGGLRAITL